MSMPAVIIARITGGHTFALIDDFVVVVIVVVIIIVVGRVLGVQVDRCRLSATLARTCRGAGAVYGQACWTPQRCRGYGSRRWQCAGGASGNKESVPTGIFIGALGRGDSGTFFAELAAQTLSKGLRLADPGRWNEQSTGRRIEPSLGQGGEELSMEGFGSFPVDDFLELLALTLRQAFPAEYRVVCTTVLVVVVVVVVVVVSVVAFGVSRVGCRCRGEDEGVGRACRGCTTALILVTEELRVENDGCRTASSSCDRTATWRAAVERRRRACGRGGRC
jgi:hypothetical protein